MTDQIEQLPVEELLAALREDWARGGVRGIFGKELRRLGGTEHDQETVGANPYWDILRLLPVYEFGSSQWRGHPIEVERFPSRPEAERDVLVKAYAWSIPTPSDIAWIVTLLDGRGVVEVGAATGYWAWQLSQAGVDVAAFDVNAFGENTYCGPVQYHPVQVGGTEVAAEYQTRALLLCWPPYAESMAVDALNAHGGELLVYIGEPAGGCTGDDSFFDALDADWTEIDTSPRHATWWGIHDYVTAYQRKVTP